MQHVMQIFGRYNLTSIKRQPTEIKENADTLRDLYLVINTAQLFCIIIW